MHLNLELTRLLQPASSIHR